MKIKLKIVQGLDIDCVLVGNIVLSIFSVVQHEYSQEFRKKMCLLNLLPDI